MRQVKWTVWPACVLAVALAASPLWAQVLYNVDPKKSTDNTPVPDVDKAGLNQPGGIAVDDMGCWAATASNILGAAGWGIAGTAQQKADQIYKDFITNFKVNAGDTYLKATGDCAAAAKWWVHNIGLNKAAGNGYTPDATYVNFRRKDRTLLESDYNFLLNELARCQYAGVKFVNIVPGSDIGHGMTLVGGNYGPNGKPGNPAAPVPSVWHNSDNDGPGGVNDEVYNTWNFAVGPDNMWRLDVPNTPGNLNDDWIAEGYFTACPGTPKPATAIGNFDVHYYVGLTQPIPGDPGEPGKPDKPYHCDKVIQMLTTGDNYGVYKVPAAGGVLVPDPIWDPQGLNTLLVPNQSVQNMQKKLYLQVDFNIPLPGNPQNPNGDPNLPGILVYDDAGNLISLADSTWASDNGEVLLEYDFDTQPAWEKIVFPSDEYVKINLVGNQGYNVLEWNIATECVPEPATMCLLAFGALALVARRRAA